VNVWVKSGRTWLHLIKNRNWIPYTSEPKWTDPNRSKGNQEAKTLTCPTKYSYLCQKVNCLWSAVSGLWVGGLPGLVGWCWARLSNSLTYEIRSSEFWINSNCHEMRLKLQIQPIATDSVACHSAHSQSAQSTHYRFGLCKSSLGQSIINLLLDWQKFCWNISVSIYIYKFKIIS